MAITRNAAQCLSCGDILESTHRHDWVICSCGNLFIDGGREYLRMGLRDGEDSFVSLVENDNAH